MNPSLDFYTVKKWKKSQLNSPKIIFYLETCFWALFCPYSAYSDWSCDSSGDGRMYFLIKLLSIGCQNLMFCCLYRHIYHAEVKIQKYGYHESRNKKRLALTNEQWIWLLKVALIRCKKKYANTLCETCKHMYEDAILLCESCRDDGPRCSRWGVVVREEMDKRYLYVERIKWIDKFKMVAGDLNGVRE